MQIHTIPFTDKRKSKSRFAQKCVEMLLLNRNSFFSFTMPYSYSYLQRFVMISKCAKCDL